MKSTYLCIILFLTALTSYSQSLDSCYKKTADELIHTLKFTKENKITDETPAVLSVKKTISDAKDEKHSNSPWFGSTKGQEYVLVEYTSETEKTEWGFLYQVYLWKDSCTPFFIVRGDGIGLNLRNHQKNHPKS